MRANQLRIKPERRTRFTLDELLRNTPSDAGVSGWDTSPPVGEEQL